MKEVKVPAVLHIYAFGLAWLVWALILPLYSLLHFAGAFAFSLITCLVVRKLFPPKKIYVPIPPEEEKPFSTGDAMVDELIGEGKAALGEMKTLHDRIPDAMVAGKVAQIITISGKIIDNLKEDPQQFRQVQRFLRYYLPTTLKLLHTYDRMGAQEIQGENVLGTKAKIEDVLDNMIVSYKKQLDALFAHKAMDVEAEIKVLESFLNQS